jgi:hypothetical protein
LNIDGACRDGVIGCGGVIRGSDREWLNGFSKLIGLGDGVIGCGGVIRGSDREWLNGFSKLIGLGDAYIAEL